MNRRSQSSIGAQALLAFLAILLFVAAGPMGIKDAIWSGTWQNSPNAGGQSITNAGPLSFATGGAAVTRTNLGLNAASYDTHIGTEGWGALVATTIHANSFNGSGDITADGTLRGTSVVAATINGRRASNISNPYQVAIPTDVPNCQLWLKADAVSGVDGDVISTWPDSSGNSRNATASGSARPTLKTDIMGGNPVLRFDGSANAMATSYTFPTSFDHALTLFFVVGAVPDNAGSRVILSASAGWYIGANTSYPDSIYGNIGGTTAIGTNTCYNPVSINMFRYNGTSTVVHAFGMNINGVTGSLANSGMSGSPLLIGSLAGSFFFPGDIAEIIAYDRVLTDAETSGIENYLAAKYRTISKKLICIGDSLTNGQGGNPYSYPGYMAARIGGSWSIAKTAISGASSAEVLTSSRTGDFWAAKSLGHDHVIVWLGTNDKLSSTAATSYARIKAFHLLLRKMGYTTTAVTLLPRTTDTDDTWRTEFNGYITTNWRDFADSLADVGANHTIGDKGDETNSTYYVDGTHLNSAGYSIVADIIQEALRP